VNLWWVIEGDDHEKRLVEASAEADAIENALLDFESQYGTYNRDLLTSLGSYPSEEQALAAHPDAS
jgi:hypothetical protein